MQTETVSYQVDGYDVSLTVSEATVLVGMRRTRLKLAGDKAERERAKDYGYDADRHLLRATIYPDLIAATVEARGLAWPLEFEEFLGLPEQLWVAWEQAVYRLNPHWLPSPEQSREKKDDPTNSSDG
jgi:hypothetical protein